MLVALSPASPASGMSAEGVQMGLRELAYKLYERRLEASLSRHTIPRHVGVILDGNRRWARSAGLTDVSHGHQKGADNMSRSGAEVEALLRIIEGTVRELMAQGWHVKPVGALDLLPVDSAQVLKDAAEATADNPGLLVNVAVGYGGRQEIADAVRSLLQDHATKGTASRSWPRSWTWSTSPTTCTRPDSPTRTW